MKLDPTMTDRTCLEEIGARLARYRLNRNFSQADLAREAGVGTRTVQRIERGQDATFSSVLRVLRVLHLFGLENLIPEPPISPIALAELQGKQRRRARQSKASDTPSPWKWNE